jgi:hypothetical protein
MLYTIFTKGKRALFTAYRPASEGDGNEQLGKCANLGMMGGKEVDNVGQERR